MLVLLNELEKNLSILGKHRSEEKCNVPGSLVLKLTDTFSLFCTSLNSPDRR